MKKLILLLLLLFPSIIYGAELVNGVSTEITCPLTRISDGLDLTSGTVNLRVQKINTGDGEDGYYLTTSNTWQAGVADLLLTYRYGNIWSRNITSNYSGQLRLSCVDATPSAYRVSWNQTVYPANRFDDTTDYVKLSAGTGTGQVSLSSGAVTVGTINPNVITATSIQDGAITPAKEYIVAGTVNATSTTLRVYTALGVTGARTYNNMCLYSASNGERSRIMSTGNGYFNVRGFSVAPADTTVLRVYTDGCL